MATVRTSSPTRRRDPSSVRPGKRSRSRSRRRHASRAGTQIEEARPADRRRQKVFDDAPAEHAEQCGAVIDPECDEGNRRGALNDADPTRGERKLGK